MVDHPHPHPRSLFHRESTRDTQQLALEVSSRHIIYIYPIFLREPMIVRFCEVRESLERNSDNRSSSVVRRSELSLKLNVLRFFFFFLSAFILSKITVSIGILYICSCLVLSKDWFISSPQFSKLDADSDK